MSQARERGSHEAMSRPKGGCNKGWTGLAGWPEGKGGVGGDVNTNLKIFSGVSLACKRHPPFISAPCRPKPNLQLIHTRAYDTRRKSRRTGYDDKRDRERERRSFSIYPINSNNSHKFGRSVFGSLLG